MAEISLKRLATFKPSVSNDAIIIETDRALIKISQALASAYNTTQITAALRQGTGLTDIFVHRNRDDSIAIATGQEPDTWPEYQPEPEI